MSFLFRLRIGARMVLAFGFIVALMLVVLAAVLLQIGRVERLSAELVEAQAERLSLAQEWYQNIAVNSQRALAIGLSSDDVLEQVFGDKMKSVTARTSEIVKRYTELETTDEGRRGIEAMSQVRLRYLDQRKALLAARGDAARVAAEGAAFQKVTAEYIEQARQVLAYQQQRQREIGAGVQAASEALRWTAVVVSLLASVAAVVMGWTLSRGITGPLAALQATARRIAAGDLAENIALQPGEVETVQLGNEIVRMQQSLRALVGQVHEVAESIEVASSEVAAGNADLSARTESTASSLEETSSTMQSLTGTVRQTAESARSANELARSAGTVAGDGGTVVRDLVRSMEAIHRSSRRVAEIIGTITLAQRSAQAAREIKALIDDSVREVELGTRSVGDAGRSMDEIVAAVQRVGEVVDGISATTAEQSEGIVGVNAAIVQIEQSTQQNAALVEQSTAAAASLREQARRLTSLVGGFRLD
ncbi:methyl-accepting chemotaxis protein [Rubrivivax gelatinosus]|uniref:methyl-accepting chemotaxis protein n=1 Tax=Rubrivivax gelatinosus TaxID=28068 RepID=UPI0002E659EA|nr:methyl-accepting chemotaxis protein [Rubrivivax gelatinosus]